MVITTSDNKKEQIERIENTKTISTHTLIPYGRALKRADITKFVNKLKKEEKECKEDK